jgi:RNA polymerase sigma factor (sigma-70 family)
LSAHHKEQNTRIEHAVPAHAPALLAYFARRVTPSHDAADLLSETLLIVWKRAAALPDKDDEIRPWMFGVARNILMHHQRSMKRRQAVADRLRSLISTTASPGFVDSSEFDDLHDALRTLNQIDRDIIGLIHWDGLSLVEVSKVLRMKEGTVRSRYHRSRARLRAELKADAPSLESQRY